MIRKLTIQNYAIIDELDIEFPGHLHVITGETGAGKSIIAGALGLILGDRSDSSVLVNKEKKCIVEGLFPSEGRKSVRDFFKEHDLEYEEEVVLRREIAVNGKSRAFINDTPVTLTQIQQLGSLLVDLHRQFDTLELGESDFQREVVDAIAGHDTLLREYQSVFHQWKELGVVCAELSARQQQLDKEAGFNQFQFDELEEAAFRDNELEDADAELKMLNNAEGIRAALDKLSWSLEEGETPMVQQLKMLIQQLQPWSSMHSGLESIITRLTSLQIELKDIAGETAHISRAVNNDPQKLEQLNERLSLGYKLMKKHGVQTTRELLGIREALAVKLQDVQSLQEQIAEKEKERKKLEAKALALGKDIAEGRKAVLKPLEKKVNALLAQVGMPNARLKAETKTVALYEYGIDHVDFLFNANMPAGKETTSHTFQPLAKVASGGELSRLMLCIKSLVASSVDLPTMIFDEIDTGISGEAARQVGILLKELAARRQVICITHQPQIAGKADTHFFVFKKIAGDKVQTSIRQLTTDERIVTIAQMLSGEKPTAAALQNAREMVMN
ncbi:MAG: DNA repair protein RecN [Chitinophagaceae bacterium]|nr:DNA repair protein RecN [Chitinophagaceae bacterium]